MEQFKNENKVRIFGRIDCNEFHIDKSAFSEIIVQRNEIVPTNKNSDSVSQFTNSNVKYNSVDDIIQKYKYNTSNQKNIHYLHKHTGSHALFAPNIEFTHSAQSCTPEYKVHETLKCKSEIKHSNNKKNYENMNDHRNNTCCRYKDDGELRIPNDVKVGLTSNEKMYHDKTTYCRPVINYYNEQFIYKTMERNARLKRLVRKLAIARQKEKENVSWNNFINELKNKHEINHDEVREPQEYITPEIIDDYYNTKFSCIQSRPCKYLLEEFYGFNDESHSDCTHYRQYNENNRRKSEVKKYFPHERNPYCYPTSSQGRLILMDRERRLKQSINHWPNHLSDKNLYIRNEKGKRYVDGVANTKFNKQNSACNGNISHDRATSVNIKSSLQENLKLYPNFTLNTNQDKATYKPDEYEEQNCFATYRNTENTQKSDNNLKRISLTNIDIKLQTLIESINTFINEIKSNKSKKIKLKDNYLNCKNNNKDELIKMENVLDNKVKTLETVDTITNDISQNNGSNYNRNEWPLKMNGLLQGRSMHNSKSLQINNAFTNQPCSVQITFEVPTKDCSTEVTKSLSKQNLYSKNKDAIIEEISTPEQILPLQRMTIAVNTDPLSFLGLLKISTDTFKRFLSYMPNFDYYSYLSLLQFPLSPKRIEPHYVCNICGADFKRPSQLSDHIRDHNLGKTKDCCVCRHVLDTARKSSGLFRCRYCGQLFARAYCCELHQESCARRLGRHHDVSSSLMLLR